MGDKYVECHKTHKHLDGKSDGCQEFMELEWDSLKCEVCGCHRNFHRKVVPPEVVYTKCCKIHDFKFQSSVDGCQEFKPKGKVHGSADALTCAVCCCHKGFHRNEVTTTS